MLLMIDNYDSFTYNLVQYFFELGVEVEVFRNDAIGVDEVATLKPAAIVLSPGPGTPDDAGVCLKLVERFAARIPILGVCLGHQVIAQAFGGRIVHARRVMHGRTSPIEHNGRGVFAGIPSPFTATRYHSLVCERDRVPDALRMTAWTRRRDGQIGEIMGLRHRRFPLEGVQFHPEAILTRYGYRLLANFLGGAGIAPIGKAVGAAPTVGQLVRASDAHPVARCTRRWSCRLLTPGPGLPAL